MELVVWLVVTGKGPNEPCLWWLCYFQLLSRRVQVMIMSSVPPPLHWLFCTSVLWLWKDLCWHCSKVAMVWWWLGKMRSYCKYMHIINLLTGLNSLLRFIFMKNICSILLTFDFSCWCSWSSLSLLMQPGSQTGAFAGITWAMELRLWQTLTNADAFDLTGQRPVTGRAPLWCYWR
jgi:hypothetical protein